MTLTAELGEYFSLATEANPSWRTFASLIDPKTVADFVDRTRATIAATAGCESARIPLRMAASSYHLGVVARLISPMVGAAICYQKVPLLTAESIRWQPTDHHYPRFGAPQLRYADGQSADQAAEAISESVIDSVLRPLHDMIRSVTALSPKVMWGNVISAANGAVTVLALSRPQFERRGRALVRALADTEYLVHTASFEHDKFVRRSCCLFYTGPYRSLCGDCVLAPP